MDELLNQFQQDPIGRLVFDGVIRFGVSGFSHFLFVISRLAGLFVLAPAINRTALPLSLRWCFSLVLALIVAPSSMEIGIQGLSPIVLLGSQSPLPVKQIGELVLQCGGELLLGSLIGIAIIGMLSGIELGGEWLERHVGLGHGSLMNPGWSSSSPCGTAAMLLAVASLLLLEPVGGHLQILHAVLDSFRQIPPGSNEWAASMLQILGRVAQQSMILGIRVALPLVTLMLIFEFTLAFASRQGAELTTHAFPAIRVGIGLFVIAFTLTGFPEVIELMVESGLQVLTEIR